MKAIANRVDALACVSYMDLSVEAEAFGAKIQVFDAEVPKDLTEKPVFAGMIGPYSLAGRLVDVSQAMIYCMRHPGEHAQRSSDPDGRMLRTPEFRDLIRL